MSVHGHRGIPVSVCLFMLRLLMLMEGSKTAGTTQGFAGTQKPQCTDASSSSRLPIWIFHKVSLRSKRRRMKCNDNREEGNKFRSCTRRVVPAHVQVYGVLETWGATVNVSFYQHTSRSISISKLHVLFSFPRMKTTIALNFPSGEKYGVDVTLESGRKNDANMKTNNSALQGSPRKEVNYTKQSGKLITG